MVKITDHYVYSVLRTKKVSLSLVSQVSWKNPKARGEFGVMWLNSLVLTVKKLKHGEMM